MKTIGALIVAAVLLASVAAPFLAPHDSGEEFRAFLFAPPMRPRIVDDAGRWRRPFVYPLRLVSRLERRYEEDRSRLVPLVFLSGGRLVGASDERDSPWLLLGADSYGRDIFARLLFGARASLGVALAAALGALAIGMLAGALAGYVGGAIDESIMRLAEFVLVLPAVYLVLALRAVLPLVLPASTVFLLMAAILALAGWPYIARGVRAIVAAELQREYAAAARALGAGHARLLLRHLLPATAGFLAVQVTLLLPLFILAEATLSFIGLGFPDPVPSWGSMLHDASNVSAIADFPWTLSPAAAIFAIVFGVNLIVQGAGRPPVSTLYGGVSRR